MHICFITSEYPKKGFTHGGIGTFIKTIGEALVKSGHKVTIVGINNYTRKNEVGNENGILIHHLRPRIFKGLTWHLNYQSINRTLESVHRQNPIDIIESSELGLAFIKKIKGIKYIIRLHGGHHFFAEAENRSISWWKAYQEKRSFKKADGFIAVSEYVKTHTAKYLSYHNKPIIIIRSPINFKLFQSESSDKIVPHTILFAGTVCEKKGVHKLIEAMPIVCSTYPDAQLHIYGRDWYFPDGGSYITYLKTAVLPKLGTIASQIKFMGPVPIEILAEKYAQAEVCVFPSLMETQGLVAPEAMATGKLVVFSKYGLGPETIEHGETGLLCDSYNPADIADQIKWAFNHPQKATEIAKAGAKFVFENFELKKILQMNVAYFQSIIKSEQEV
jgi:glycosyltransferase involved in cell wall biosynthesis